jgi:hypothetical protein
MNRSILFALLGCGGLVTGCQNSGVDTTPTAQLEYNLTVAADRARFLEQDIAYQGSVGPYAVYKVTGDNPQLVGPYIQVQQHVGYAMLCGASHYFIPQQNITTAVKMSLLGGESGLVPLVEAGQMPTGDGSCSQPQDQFGNPLPPGLSGPSGGAGTNTGGAGGTGGTGGTAGGAGGTGTGGTGCTNPDGCGTGTGTTGGTGGTAGGTGGTTGGTGGTAGGAGGTGSGQTGCTNPDGCGTGTGTTGGTGGSGAGAGGTSGSGAGGAAGAGSSGGGYWTCDNPDPVFGCLPGSGTYVPPGGGAGGVAGGAGGTGAGQTGCTNPDGCGTGTGTTGGTGGTAGGTGGTTGGTGGTGGTAGGTGSGSTGCTNPDGCGTGTGGTTGSGGTSGSGSTGTTSDPVIQRLNVSFGTTHPAIGSTILIRRVALTGARQHNDSHIIPPICCTGGSCSLGAM